MRLSGRQGRSQHCPPPGPPAAPILRPSGGGGAQCGARDVASGVLGGKLSQAHGTDGACGGETRGWVLGGPPPSPLPLGLWGRWRGGQPWSVWVRGLCGPRLGARACGIPEGWGVVGPRGPHGTSLLTHRHTHTHTQTQSHTQTHTGTDTHAETHRHETHTQRHRQTHTQKHIHTDTHTPAGRASTCSGRRAYREWRSRTGLVLVPSPSSHPAPGGVGDGKEVDRVSGL